MVPPTEIGKRNPETFEHLKKRSNEEKPKMIHKTLGKKERWTVECGHKGRTLGHREKKGKARH
jgi:hypothetical protein